MKTLADVLRYADPMADESRSEQARAVTRARVLATAARLDPIRAAAPRRAIVLATVLGVAGLALGVFAWRHASVDAVAAMRFEARIAGSDEPIVDNHDILTAEVVPGSTAERFNVAVTLTQEGGEKMRRATEAHIGEHLELVTDGTVVMAPIIRSAVSTSAMLSGDYTHAEARRVADGLLKGKLEIQHEP